MYIRYTSPRWWPRKGRSRSSALQELSDEGRRWRFLPDFGQRRGQGLPEPTHGNGRGPTVALNMMLGWPWPVEIPISDPLGDGYRNGDTGQLPRAEEIPFLPPRRKVVVVFVLDGACGCTLCNGTIGEVQRPNT